MAIIVYNARFHATIDICAVHPRFLSLSMSQQQDARHYEVMAIISPEFSDKSDEMMAPFRSLVESHGGEVTRYENWGRRNLAYSIEKKQYGCYVLLNFSTQDEDLVEEFERALSSSDQIVRSLLSRTNRLISGPSPARLEAEKKELEARNEATNAHKT